MIVSFGVQSGETILSIPGMVILVMAPVASLIIEFTYSNLLNRGDMAQPGTAHAET